MYDRNPQQTLVHTSRRTSIKDSISQDTNSAVCHISEKDDNLQQQENNWDSIHPHHE